MTAETWRAWAFFHRARTRRSKLRGQRREIEALRVDQSCCQRDLATLEVERDRRRLVLYKKLAAAKQTEVNAAKEATLAEAENDVYAANEAALAEEEENG